MATDPQLFPVDVIYALAGQQKVITIHVTPETTFLEAVQQSGMQDFYPEIDLDKIKLGTFSRLVKPKDLLEPGMRVEIYRPLIADPKEARRRRAEKAKLQS